MKTNQMFTSLLATGLLSVGTALTSGCKPTLAERTTTERSVDGNISETVKAALGTSPSFKFPDVQVTSFNGKVQLSGFVVSEDQREAAEAITKAVPGVIDIENKISLKR